MAGLERPFPPDAELELAGAAVELVVRYRDAVVEPDRADGQIQADADAPVVVKDAGAKAVRLLADTANVKEHGEAHTNTVLLLENGNAVFHRAEPESVAANRLLVRDGRCETSVVLARADVAVFEATARATLEEAWQNASASSTSLS